MADKMNPEKFLGDACAKLAQPEHAELLEGLAFFVDMWGLDAYTPPEQVEMRVREIVKGFVTGAQINQRNAAEFESEFPST